MTENHIDFAIQQTVRLFSNSIRESIKSLDKENLSLSTSIFVAKKAQEEIQNTIELFRSIKRNLIDYQTNIVKIQILDISDVKKSVSWEEKYIELYESVLEDGSTFSFTTEGYLIKKAVITLESQNNWVIEEYSVDYFSGLPTSSLVNSDENVITPSIQNNGNNFLWAWDGKTAGAYSDKYASDPNGEYRTYDVDCTNFASQCLKIGGKDVVDGDRQDSRYWYYGLFAQTTTYSWAGAFNLYEHLTKYTDSQIVNSVSELRIGDLIFMDYSYIEGPINHVMIVAEKIESSDVLLNYHSINTRRKSFLSIKSENPTAKFYFVKIGTTYKP
jgi:guanyl-specific ribonuclease Sa